MFVTNKNDIVTNMTVFINIRTVELNLVQEIFGKVDILAYIQEYELFQQTYRKVHAFLLSQY